MCRRDKADKAGFAWFPWLAAGTVVPGGPGRREFAPANQSVAAAPSCGRKLAQAQSSFCLALAPISWPIVELNR